MPHCEEAHVPKFSVLSDVSMEYDEFHEEVESSASNSGGSVFNNIFTVREKNNYFYILAKKKNLFTIKNIEGLLLKMGVQQYRAQERHLSNSEFEKKFKMCIAT